MDNKIILEAGELICPTCHGEGFKFVTVNTGYKNNKRKAYCNKCGGDGKIDWIQNATGEDKPFKSAKGFPGLKGMEMVWGHDVTNIKKPKPFDIKDFDPTEIEEVYHKIVENLSRD